MMLPLALALPASGTVLVSSPTNGQTVSSTVQFSATANTTTCSKGVASMGIYVDNKLEYVVDGIKLNTSLPLASGKHNVAVQEWDYCGGATLTPMQLNVASATQDSIAVTLPLSGSTVSSPTAFLATASSSCAKGVAATGVYVDNNLMYQGPGSKLSAQVALAAGSHTTVVQAWDNCGGVTKQQVNLTVGGAASKTIYNVQSLSGWNQWGELAPLDNICNAPCNNQVNWSMNQNNSSVSLSGNSTQFNLGGVTPYSDVLFSNPVLGQGNTQGLNDAQHLILPAIHNFTLDTEVYVTNLSVTQSLELDVNWYANGIGMEWGTQCNHLGDQSWDIWDNVHAHWFSTGVACNLNNAAWNHVVIQVQREPNNDLLYQTITVNGVVNNINTTVPPFSVPQVWYGMTVNFQMDGNVKQSPYTLYADNMNFTYW
ncbi:MAG: hypothetical protein HIU91_07465 [Acidobacteria bacterium]|nr:hypothetical protein [Acidobacteriota bacterium]